MNIRIIAIGKLKEKYWQDAVKEYAKRLGSYCTLQIIELKESPLRANPSAADEDTWYFSLQQSGLTDFLDRNGYPAGVYQLDYYIGGELADAVTFELK